MHPVMKTYLVSLGSNENRYENMSECKQQLCTYFQYIVYSDMLETEPVGRDFTKMFYNQLAIMHSDQDLSAIKQKLKDIEKRLGRKPTDKPKGIVIMDVDVLAVNDRIIKPEDFTRPYIYRLLSSFHLSNPLLFNEAYLKACVNTDIQDRL